MFEIYNNQNFLVNLAPNDQNSDKKMSFTDRVLYGNISDGLFGSSKSPERKRSEKNKERSNIKKRKRKSNFQLKVLKTEYSKDEFWSKEKILKIS